MTGSYYGKFHGTVKQNDDPDHRCRIKVEVPDVLPGTTDWCLPALPYVGLRVGWTMVPPVGASVWVEWPDGDLGKTPVWTGGCWPDGTGVDGAGPGTILLVTPKEHRIEISDDNSSITLKAAGGAMISLSGDGITLDNGQGATIILKGGRISLNGNAFQVEK